VPLSEEFSRKAFGENISKMKHEKPNMSRAQRIAIALQVARKAGRGKLPKK
jgi:hypothetical protein